MTAEELFRIAPQCKDMVLKKLCRKWTEESTPGVPSYQAERTLSDRGAYVQISVKGVTIFYNVETL